MPEEQRRAETPEFAYRRAPITEAVIDIRVQPLGKEKLAGLDELAASIRAEFPKSDQTLEAAGQIQVGETMQSTITQTRIGVICESADGLRRVQFRLNGFSFHRLAPYDRWRTMADEALGLWTQFRTVAGENTATRVAVRYINRLDLPLTPAGEELVLDFNAYLRLLPSNSSAPLITLDRFFLQVTSPQRDLDATSVLNEAFLGRTSETIASVILDIDLFRDAAVPTADEDIWQLLERFRVRKNDIFESCITDKARQLFQ